MKAFWFRFLAPDGHEGRDTSFVGLAVAANMVDLFWEIDQYGNPFEVEIQPVQRGGSFCVGVQKTQEFGVPFFEPKNSTLEVSEATPLEVSDAPSNKPNPDWQTPKWPRNRSFTSRI